MNVAVQLGAEVELATKDDVVGSIGDGIDKVLGAIPKRRRKPLLRRIPASQQVAVGAATTILSFGNVPNGYTFELTHCVVVGADSFTVLAGATAALYIGNSSMVSLGNIAQPGIPVPSFWNIGNGVLYGHVGDEVFLVVTGAAAGANVSAVLSVLQHTEDTVEAGGI